MSQQENQKSYVAESFKYYNENIVNYITEVNQGQDINVDQIIPSVANSVIVTNGLGTESEWSFISSANITPLGIQEASLANSAVTTNKIADGSVTITKIATATAPNNVLRTNLGSSTPEWGLINTANISDNAITIGKIVDASLNDQVLVTFAGTRDPAWGYITTANITDDNITTAKIADNNVTVAKIEDASLNDQVLLTSAGTVNPAWGYIATANISNNAVTVAKIEDASSADQVLLTSAGTVNPAWGYITTANITDANITTAKIADNNVTVAKIEDASLNDQVLLTSAGTVNPVWGYIATANISDNAITVAKIVDASLADQVLLTSAGTVNPAWGYIGTANISDNAITVAKIVDASLADQVLLTSAGTVNPAWGYIGTANISDNAVTVAKIVDASLVDQVLLTSAGTVNPAWGYVNTANVSDDAITFAKMYYSMTPVITTPHNVNSSQYYIIGYNSANVIQLPTFESFGSGQMLIVQNHKNGGTLTIQSTGPQTIDGQASITLTANGQPGNYTEDEAVFLMAQSFNEWSILKLGTNSIVNNSVTVAKIEDASSNDQVLLTAAGTTNPAWGFINTDNISNGAVTSAKIASNTIVLGDINASFSDQNLTTSSNVQFSQIQFDTSGYLNEQTLQLDQTTTQASIKDLTLTGNEARTFIYGLCNQSANLSLSSSTAYGGCLGVAKHFAQDGSGDFQRVSDVAVSVMINGDDAATTIKKCEAIHEFYHYDNATEVTNELRRVSYINKSGGMTSASDQRFKENIQVLEENVLDRFEKIKVYTYSFKNQKEQQIGFIGQELVKEFQLATNYTKHFGECAENCDCKKNEEKTIFVDYGRMSVYCSKAIQELLQQSRQQQIELESIRQEKKALNAKIKELEEKSTMNQKKMDSLSYSFEKMQQRTAELEKKLNSLIEKL